MTHKLKPTQQNKKYLKHNRKLRFNMLLAKYQEKMYSFIGTGLYYIFIHPVNYVKFAIEEERNRYWLLHSHELKVKMFNEIQNEIEYDLYKQAGMLIKHNYGYTVTDKILEKVESKCDIHIGELIRNSETYSCQHRRDKSYKFTNIYNELEGKHLSDKQLNWVTEECLDHIERYFKYVNDDTFVERKVDKVVDREYNRVDEEYLMIKFK